MAGYEIVVPLDWLEGADQWRTAEQLLRSGWNATHATLSPDDTRLLVHKEFESLNDGQVELDRIGGEDARAHALLYQPVQLRQPGRWGPIIGRSGVVVSNMATSQDALNFLLRIAQDRSDVGDSTDASVDAEPPNPPGPPGPDRPPNGVSSEPKPGPDTASRDNDAAGSGVDGALPSTEAEIKIVDLYWGVVDDSLKKQLAQRYFESQLDSDKARLEWHAWRAASDWVLLNTVNTTDSAGQARIATAMLEARHGLMTEQGQKDMTSIRAKLAQVGIESAGSVRSGIDQWRKLAKVAPWFMGAALVISVAILVGAFLLVKWGHLNGYQFAVVIFVCALFVVSPATLLLLERPLRGIDAASFGGKQLDPTKSK
jgi:hypothetical protein